MGYLSPLLSLTNREKREEMARADVSLLVAISLLALRSTEWTPLHRPYLG